MNNPNIPKKKMTSNISETQAQSFINVFQHLGEAFHKLSKTSILPKDLLSTMKESKEKANSEESSLLTQTFKKETKSPKLKSTLSYMQKKSPILTNDLDINENREESSEEDETSEYKEVNKKEIYESENEKNEGSESCISSNSSNDKELVFLDQQGWEFKLKMCDLSIEMGPFISQRKAKSAISFIRQNESLLNKMPMKERRLWIKSLSTFIETLLL